MYFQYCHDQTTILRENFQFNKTVAGSRKYLVEIMPELTCRGLYIRSYEERSLIYNALGLKRLKTGCLYAGTKTFKKETFAN